ncbi:hypothetical protein [Streptomyces sp. NPDC056628]
MAVELAKPLLDCLVEAVGQETAERLVAVAEQAELAPRPPPTLRW